VSRGDPLYYAKGPDVFVANSDHRRRFVEKAVPLHAPLYIVGQARERADVVAPGDRRKQGRPRCSSSRRVPRSASKKASPSLVGLVGTRPADRPGFLLIGLSQTPELHGSPLLVQIPAATLVAYLMLWGLSWVWMAYNSLVGLRQRVRQAGRSSTCSSNRRHDLIPNLAAAVSGLSQHERETQTALAALRAQMTATRPGVAGPDFEGVAASLRAVWRNIRKLIAQESFAPAATRNWSRRNKRIGARANLLQRHRHPVRHPVSNRCRTAGWLGSAQ